MMLRKAGKSFWPGARRAASKSVAGEGFLRRDLQQQHAGFGASRILSGSASSAANVGEIAGTFLDNRVAVPSCINPSHHGCAFPISVMSQRISCQEHIKPTLQAASVLSAPGHPSRSCSRLQSIVTVPELKSGFSSAVEAFVEIPTEDTLLPQVLKTKKLTKTAKHIMEILDREAVEAARKDREIPDVQPGDIVQLRVEVPENKRRISLLKGIVIARRNSGINTTFRIRRVLAGVGVEMVFPLYSPNVKDIKVIEKRKVRRAKLFYLRKKIARMSSV